MTHPHSDPFSGTFVPPHRVEIHRRPPRQRGLSNTLPCCNRRPSATAPTSYLAFLGMQRPSRESQHLAAWYKKKENNENDPSTWEPLARKIQAPVAQSEVWPSHRMCKSLPPPPSCWTTPVSVWCVTSPRSNITYVCVLPASVFAAWPHVYLHLLCTTKGRGPAVSILGS